MTRAALIFVLVVAAVAGGVWTHQAAADLAVVQIGAGAAPLSNASTPVFVKLISNAGVHTINMPTTADGLHKPLTLSNTIAEGYLALSTNGQYLTLAGYGAEPGFAAVSSSTTAAVNRVVGRIRLSDGSVDTTTALTGSSFTGSSVRSAVTIDGSRFWMAGNAALAANAGVHVVSVGASTSTRLSGTVTNVRVVDIVDGQLYVSSAANGAGSVPFFGVSTVGVVGNGVPTSGTTHPTTLLPGFSGNTNSSFDYWFADADTLYVADDRDDGIGGGIQKWTRSGGVWSLAYTLSVDEDWGARGLTGALENGLPALYATTAELMANNLVKIVDQGAGSAFSVVTTAAENTVYRGLQFFSVPEASGLLFGSATSLATALAIAARRRRRWRCRDRGHDTQVGH